MCNRYFGASLQHTSNSSVLFPPPINSEPISSAESHWQSGSKPPPQVNMHSSTLTTPHPVQEQNKIAHTESTLPIEKRTSPEEHADVWGTHSKHANGDTFRFPDEVSDDSGMRPALIEFDTKHNKNTNRRQSNTRRPASGESRQPSSSSYISRTDAHWPTEGSIASTSTVSGLHSSGDIGSRKPPGRGQAVWRRPNPSDKSDSSDPTPPMPSTVPTPTAAPSHVYKKGMYVNS